MQVETLKAFCDLIETGSFTRAAELNFVSQSAVSQQLRGLERRFERKLVERGGGLGVEPTAAGRLVYAESKAILARLRSLEEQLREPTGAMSGTVRVATVYSVGLHALPPHVKQFLREHPQVQIQMEYSRTDRVVEACLSGDIDLGIVAFPTRRAKLEVIPLRDEELVLVVSPEHRLARRHSATLAALRGEAFVAFDRSVPTRRYTDRALRRHGVQVRVTTEFDNIETIKRSVEAGLGVSIVPEDTVKNEVRAGTLVALALTDERLIRPVGIIHRRHRELSAPARAFADLLVREMGARR
ncbi:MAG TPA: LysR family transcriptional regulator [Polyangiaceae bacterium]|nr:LysR family transcriptional regulator [Polyangiaceae bacterium]